MNQSDSSKFFTILANQTEHNEEHSNYVKNFYIKNIFEDTWIEQGKNQFQKHSSPFIIVSCDCFSQNKKEQFFYNIVYSTIKSYIIEHRNDLASKPFLLIVHIVKLFELIHNRIQKEIEKKYQQHDSCGCSINLIFIQENTGYVFWTGNIRSYLFRKGVLMALTKDHTSLPAITEGNNTDKIILTKFVGTFKGSPVPSYKSFQIEDNDVILTIPSSIHSYISDGEIANILSTVVDIDSAYKALINEALKKQTTQHMGLSLCLYGIYTPIGSRKPESDTSNKTKQIENNPFTGGKSNNNATTSTNQNNDDKGKINYIKVIFFSFFILIFLFSIALIAFRSKEIITYLKSNFISNKTLQNKDTTTTNTNVAPLSEQNILKDTSNKTPPTLDSLKPADTASIIAKSIQLYEDTLYIISEKVGNSYQLTEGLRKNLLKAYDFLSNNEVFAGDSAAIYCRHMLNHRYKTINGSIEGFRNEYQAKQMLNKLLEYLEKLMRKHKSEDLKLIYEKLYKYTDKYKRTHRIY